MKNKVLFGLLLAVLIIPIVVADGNGSIDNVQKAYNCLENRIGNRTDLSLDEAIFSTLALGYKSSVFESIDKNKKSDEMCWPKNGCKLKETAQVALAYNRVQKDADGIVSWISSKNATSSELIWYLEIDNTNHIPSSCKIKYDGQEKSIEIRADMKLQGSPGSCFDIASEGYWLKINNNCLNKEFSISCDQDFITTLIYQKSGGGTIYVSSKTNSAPSLGNTKEKVSAKCFKTSGICDYEGSLWAALALQKLGEDVSDYVPYLLALADDNEKYFPSAFLYSLTSGDDQYGKIIQSQKQNKYWQQAGTPYNRFYDTSIAMLALKTNAPAEFSAGQGYLLSIQTSEGCWNNNNIRDSAFVLYSGWEKDVLPYFGSSGSSGGGIAGCDLPRSCELASACQDAGGEVLYSYDCPSILEVCCSKVVPKLTCNEIRGLVCPSNQQCSGEVVSSADGACCKAACQNVAQDSCEKFKVGTCRSLCYSDEEEKSESCDASGGVCCAKKAEESSTNWWLWSSVLIVLIILVVLGIIFRTKLQVWWFKRKNSGSSTGGTSNNGMPPRGMPPRTGLMAGRAMQGRFMPRTSGRDRIMDDTIRKLKEMSG